MNYIKQLNAFKDWLLWNKIPTSAIILWHALMMINNATGWKKKFNAQNSMLQLLTGLSKQGVANARAELVAQGLIIYQKGHIGKAATYQIASLVNSVDQVLDQSIAHSVDQAHSVDPFVDNVLAIPKQEEEVEERRRGRSDSHLISIYEQNFGVLKPILRDPFMNWCQELGDELVIYGIKLAAEMDGRSYSYLNAIFKEWSQAKLKTLEEVNVYQAQKKAGIAKPVQQHKKKKQSAFDTLRAELRLEGAL
ncbi:DnaD domain-containing protein [Aquibacillus rhizosphaerae]|uniref:DnaD domain protein n=1 Tax=Aquibacillus rhizosphaerae TaxID=3051431 RepID=A0ABT7L9F3_9BACI|nr:DnaD domain protein [Aquibacillus sp. LR5S19]MDL4842504.1 DnaD domain protein [Aquibacillus sp. LR5S19]